MLLCWSGSPRRCQAQAESHTAQQQCFAPSLKPHTVSGIGLVLLAVPLQAPLHSWRAAESLPLSFAGQEGLNAGHSLLQSTTWGPVVEAAGARPVWHTSCAAGKQPSTMLARYRTPLLLQTPNAAGLEPKLYRCPVQTQPSGAQSILARCDNKQTWSLRCTAHLPGVPGSRMSDHTKGWMLRCHAGHNDEHAGIMGRY